MDATGRPLSVAPPTVQRHTQLRSENRRIYLNMSSTRRNIQQMTSLFKSARCIHFFYFIYPVLWLVHTMFLMNEGGQNSQFYLFFKMMQWFYLRWDEVRDVSGTDGLEPADVYPTSEKSVKRGDLWK